MQRNLFRTFVALSLFAASFVLIERSATPTQARIAPQFTTNVSAGDDVSWAGALDIHAFGRAI